MTSAAMESTRSSPVTAPRSSRPSFRFVPSRFFSGRVKRPTKRMWHAMTTGRIPSRRTVENFVTRASPVAIPMATSRGQVGALRYSQRRYRARHMNKAAPRSVVTRQAWAIRFGSNAERVRASRAAPLPQSRYAHQPISPTRQAPRKRFGVRASVRIRSGGTLEP